MHLERSSTAAPWPIRLAGSVLLISTVVACGTVVPAGEPTPSAVAAGEGSPSAGIVPSVASSSTTGPTAPASVVPSPSEVAPSPIAGPCLSDLDMGVIPTWARTGFSEPEPAMPHILSRSGDVVAIVFGFPLASPPREDVNNKILWVHRDGPTSPVEISAQRMEGTTPVGKPVARRLEDGFAPSIVDLPDAGCWRLTLTYGDRTDSIDLEYIGTPAG